VKQELSGLPEIWSHFRNGDLTIINGIFAGYISNMIGGLVV
jgi:hypothetical protein